MYLKGLTAFTQQVIDDPLFAAEGLDLERASATLDALEEQLAATETILGNRSLAKRLFFVRYPIARFAVPVAFLRSFIESERVRRKFRAYPSQALAEELLASWRDTSLQFLHSVERYARLHTIAWTLFPESRESAKDTFDNLITQQDIECTLLQLRKNAERLREEVHSREMLLVGVSSAMRASRMSEGNSINPTFSSANRLQYPRLHELEVAHGFAFRASDIVDSWGPIEMELSTFDGNSTTHQFMAYELRDRENGIRSLRICSTDVYVFFRIGPGASKARIGEVHRPLVDRGFRWWFQPANMVYSTRDLEYMARIATAVDQHRRPWLDTKALQTQNTSLFDLLLGIYVENTKHYRFLYTELVQNLGTFPGVNFMLFFNTAPSIFFMPYNASVWRLSEKANFLGASRVSPNESKYVREEAFLSMVSTEEAERVMQGGRIREEVFEDAQKVQTTQGIKRSNTRKA